MQYFGGKAKIAKDLVLFINENYLKGNNITFVDLFCGSCNVISKIDSNRKRIANDKHKYLIAMWQELQKGWIPPKNCTKEQYYQVKNNIDVKPHVSGFIGFGCSFAGKWWGGFAKSNNRNYCSNAYSSTLAKLENLKDVIFFSQDYTEIYTPNDSVIYCDIPYRDFTEYDKKEVGSFDHDKFYEWVEMNKNNSTILISEYKENVPDGFKIVWEKQSKQDIRSGDGSKKETVEVLMTPII